MKQPDQKTAAALAEIRAHPAFRVVSEYLREDEAAEIVRSLTLDGAAMYRAQGGASKIREFISALDSAPSVVDKFNAKRG